MCLPQHRLGGLGHGLQLLVVAAVLGDRVVQDQAVLAIHGTLHVEGHLGPLVSTHQAGLVFTDDELLQPLRLQQRLGCQVVGLPVLQVLQRGLDRAAINHFSRFATVSLVQFR
ncbi:hypothetical protein D9M69_611780 [compost metagenome]